MRASLLWSALLGFTLPAALIGCAGSGVSQSGTGTLGPTPCPSEAPEVTQISPANGATGVSDSLGSILFASNTSNLETPSLNGIAQGSFQGATAPPSPAQTAPPGQSYYQSAVTSSLSPHTLYQVTFTYMDGCREQSFQYQGSFTTQ